MSGPPLTAFDGIGAEELCRRWAIPRLEVFEALGSTQDVAHELAAGGAPDGTVVLVNRQTAGRGRNGKTWQSSPDDVCLSYVMRAPAGAAIGALPLRVGLQLAQRVESLAGDRITLKWPNDLFYRNGKVAGILVEARWRGAVLDWLVIGVGVNVGQPARPFGATALPAEVGRQAVAAAVVGALRAAGAEMQPLTIDEMREFAARDRALHRRCVAPRSGVVAGIESSGALLIEMDGGGGPVAISSGSLVLEEVA